MFFHGFLFLTVEMIKCQTKEYFLWSYQLLLAAILALYFWQKAILVWTEHLVLFFAYDFVCVFFGGSDFKSAV